jgi:hypothetical protein
VNVIGGLLGVDAGSPAQQLDGCQGIVDALLLNGEAIHVLRNLSAVYQGALIIA